MIRIQRWSNRAGFDSTFFFFCTLLSCIGVYVVFFSLALSFRSCHFYSTLSNSALCCHGQVMASGRAWDCQALRVMVVDLLSAHVVELM